MNSITRDTNKIISSVSNIRLNYCPSLQETHDPNVAPFLFLSDCVCQRLFLFKSPPTPISFNLTEEWSRMEDLEREL